MSKGDTLFALTEWVEPQGRRLFDDLARREHLRGLDRDGFVTGAGQFLSDLNALHPFREGNGRTQRVFLQLLANQAGWQLAWARINPDENNTASAQAMSDRNAFRRLLAQITLASTDPIPPDALTLRHRTENPTAPPDSPSRLAGHGFPTEPQPDAQPASEPRPNPAPTAENRYRSR
jgi:cell filamentation protein